MSYLNSIIDRNRLELILRQLPEKEKKKLNRRLSRLFKGFSKDSMDFIQLMDRFNNSYFDGSKLDDYSTKPRKVIIVRSDSQVKEAVNEIKQESFIGFDTEQKPTFTRGESQNSISLIQIATSSSCFLFQCSFISVKPLLDIIADVNIKKVGFDLRNDNREFRRQFNIEPENIFDLSPFMKKGLLHRNQIGVKNSVALILGKNMQKSKKTAMSNWENRRLSDSQIKYAAEDAAAPYDIYDYLQGRFPKLHIDEKQ